MDDSEIIGLYFARDEGAIDATAQAYGSYCTAIARNILDDPQGAEECVNDTWLRCWDSIPPQRPHSLKAFVGKIVRNLALSALRAQSAQKRGGGEAALALEELNEVVSGGETPEGALDRQTLLAALDRFLAGLSRRDRDLFLRRYWYLDTAQALALRFGMSRTAVTTTLSRVRKKLRSYLQQEGFDSFS